MTSTLVETIYFKTIQLYNSLYSNEYPKGRSEETTGNLVNQE
jgi:hypothetical protein